MISSEHLQQSPEPELRRCSANKQRLNLQSLNEAFLFSNFSRLIFPSRHGLFTNYKDRNP